MAQKTPAPTQPAEPPPTTSPENLTAPIQEQPATDSTASELTPEWWEEYFSVASPPVVVTVEDGLPLSKRLLQRILVSLPDVSAETLSDEDAVLNYDVRIAYRKTEIKVAGRMDLAAIMTDELRPEAVDILGSALRSAIVRPLTVKFTSKLADMLAVANPEVRLPALRGFGTKE